MVYYKVSSTQVNAVESEEKQTAEVDEGVVSIFKGSNGVELHRIDTKTTRDTDSK